MKSLLFSMPLLVSGFLFTMYNSQPAETVKTSAPVEKGPASPADTNLTMFGRGMYPGNDTTYDQLKESGFTTVVLSSFYIRANGDVFSGDDGKNPIIHEGKYVGDPAWLKRVASLKKGKTSVTRIEILLEGRWYNQPPNTYDHILDWTDPATDPAKLAPGTVAGTGSKSTLYKMVKVMRDAIGVDALCIDDESVYNSQSIVTLGEMLQKMNLHMSLCPYTNSKYWSAILTGSKPGLIDAIYLQCYDGGKRNEPSRWKDSLPTTLSIDPLMMCRGAFSTCEVHQNSMSPDEIKVALTKFKKDYPAMKGGGIWQMADVKSYIRRNCAVVSPTSGTATTVPQYLSQLKNGLKEALQ